jgi:hypothetical protein
MKSIICKIVKVHQIYRYIQVVNIPNGIFSGVFIFFLWIFDIIPIYVFVP